MTDLYQETILDELKNPQNYGELSDADITVEETNASCGDSVTVYLKLGESQPKIQEIRWVGSGCAISQASMSLLSEKIKKMNIQEIVTLSQKNIEDMLGIEQMSVGRVKCMMLGLKAVQKALYALNSNF